MKGLWIYLDRLILLITGMKWGFPEAANDEFFQNIWKNALSEFDKIFHCYSTIFDELNAESTHNFFSKLIYDSSFKQKFIIVIAVWMFSFYVAFVKTQTSKSTSLTIIFSFVLYLTIAGTYKDAILKNFEFFYSLSYFQNIPFLVSFARLINFPIVILSFSLSITLRYIYKLFRIILFALIILRIKSLLPVESLCVESHIVLFVLNIFLFFIFYKLLKVFELTVLSILLSALGCFSMVSHLMVFPSQKENIKIFALSITMGTKIDMFRNPVFLTWLVLFTYSVKLTFTSVEYSKKI